MPTASLSIKFVGHGEYAVQMTTRDVGNYTLRIELGDVTLLSTIVTADCNLGTVMLASGTACGCAEGTFLSYPGSACLNCTPSETELPRCTRPPL